MKLLKPGDPFKKNGVWDYSNASARISCPDCGLSGSLEETHAIDPVTGGATPSLVCPADGCKFHAFIQLGAWVQK